MDILQGTIDFVTELYETQASEKLIYHKIIHTKEVVSAANLIGKKSDLSDEEMKILQICAWFHDAGYVKSYYEHELTSTQIASDFLKSKNVDASVIQTVSDSIMSTKVPQSPKSKIAEALCDADMIHLSQEDFIDKSVNAITKWFINVKK